MATAAKATTKKAEAPVSAPKAASASKAAAKAVSAEPEAPKKTPVKKAAPKQPADPTTTVIFEYGEKKVVAKELLAKAMESFRAAHGDIEIQDMQLYIKADDNCAYIVVNGTEYPEDKISF